MKERRSPPERLEEAPTAITAESAGSRIVYLAPEVGKGLPLWFPVATVRDRRALLIDLEIASGYDQVYSQELASRRLQDLGHGIITRQHVPPIRSRTKSWPAAHELSHHV